MKSFKEYLYETEVGFTHADPEPDPPTPDDPPTPTDDDDDGKEEVDCDKLELEIAELEWEGYDCNKRFRDALKKMDDIKVELDKMWRLRLECYTKCTPLGCEDTDGDGNCDAGTPAWHTCMQGCMDNPDFGQEAMAALQEAWDIALVAAQDIRAECIDIANKLKELRAKYAADCGDAVERSTRKPGPKKPTTGVTPSVTPVVSRTK